MEFISSAEYVSASAFEAASEARATSVRARSAEEELATLRTQVDALSEVIRRLGHSYMLDHALGKPERVRQRREAAWHSVVAARPEAAYLSETNRSRLIDIAQEGDLDPEIDW